MELNNQKKVLILSIIAMIVLLISSSYSIMTNFTSKDDAITFTTGNLEMTILNGEETFELINLNKKLPESDQSGLDTATVIPITLKNTGTMIIGEYDVKLVKEESEDVSTLNDEYIRFSISENNQNYSQPLTLTANENVIYQGVDLEVEATRVIYLKMWIDESAYENGYDKVFYGALKIEIRQQAKDLAPLIVDISNAGYGKINFTVEDKGKGVDKYCVNQNQEDTTNCTWLDAVIGEQTTEEYVRETGTYYVHVKDTEDNIGHSSPIEIVITYNLLDYIETNGTQYIDTGYSSANGFITDLSFSATSLMNQYVIGSHSLSDPWGRNGVGIVNNQWELGAGNSFNKSSSGLSSGVNYRIEASTVLGSSYIKVNGSQVVSSNDAATRSTLNVLIFNCQYYEQITSSPKLSAKLYYAKLYDSNNNLVRDYLPVERKSDGVVGLYDLVENKFYGNAGTGAFIKGTLVGVI